VFVQRKSSEIWDHEAVSFEGSEWLELIPCSAVARRFAQHTIHYWLQCSQKMLDIFDTWWFQPSKMMDFVNGG